MTQLATAADVQQQTAVAKRPNFNPLAPIGSANGLKSLLESQRASIAQALPRHVTPERIIKTLLVAANRNRDILKCTQASIMETINRAAEVGLDLSGTLGEAYPVPFNNKVKWTDENGNKREEWLMQLTLIIGYRGFAKLAWQSNEVARLEAEVVCANDTFHYRKGTRFELDFIPCLKGDRGPVVGAYALAEMKNGGIMAEFMPVADIEKIRQKAKSGNSPAWTDPQSKPEMQRKTVFRRLAKWLPLSTEKFVKALEADAEDFELTDVLEAETTGAQQRTGGAKALMDKVAGRSSLPGPDGQPIQVSEPIEDTDEAERILRDKSPSAANDTPPGVPAVPASESAGPSDTDDHTQEQGGGPGDEQQEQVELTPRQLFQNWKDAVFQAMKANGHTPAHAAKVWGALMLKNGCKGDKEIKFPEGEREGILTAARESRGMFATSDE